MAISMNIVFHASDSRCSLLFLTFIIAASAFIITLPGQICNAQTPYMCNNNTYAQGSKFESNLNTVLNNLVQRTSQTGFNISVYGQSPDQIQGLLQCDGYATAQQCYNCSQKAIADVLLLCGNGIGGRVWLQDCYLRYENRSFIGQLEYVGKYRHIHQNVSSSGGFNASQLEKLLDKLSGEAISGSGLYASGKTIDSLSREIYGTVQCWKDITADDCTRCLSPTINHIVTTYAGYEGVAAYLGNCKVRYEIYSFFGSNAPSTSTPPPSSIILGAPPVPFPAHNASHKMPIILGAVGGLLLVSFVCLFAYGRSLKSAIFRRLHQDDGQLENHVLNNRQILFKKKTLVTATANFHDDNKLGEGGFGSVYKGTTPDGRQIAVKKLSLKSAQGSNEFLNEVKLVAAIQHRNLVNLLGCCAKGSEKLLVYEYVANKSLDRFLFDPNKQADLDWQKRYNIIVGVARGLLYLHQDSQLRIVHRDIKASNILLDENLNPKIADFGLAKLFSEDETHVSTRAAGTLGYMAPEYAMWGQLSVKVDVYSFGVVLLEIVTGRKNTDFNLPPEMEILLGWVWNSHSQGNSVQMIDPTIIETCNEEQAVRCIQVGLLCTQADPSLRPVMAKVISMLSSASVTLPDPTRPAYVTQHTDSHVSAATSSSLSLALPSSAATSSSVSSSHIPLALPSSAPTSITILTPR